MVWKRYLRGTAANVNDVPATEQSSVLPAGGDYSGTPVRKDLLPAAGSTDTATGPLTTAANTSEQSGCHGLWCSERLGAQTLTGGQTWTVALTGTENNLNANAQFTPVLYVWRPSGAGTGSVVKVIYDSSTDLGSEFSTASPTVPTSGEVFSIAGAAGDFSIEANDVIVLEVWTHTDGQGNANARSIRTFYDGPTDVTAGGTGGGAYISVPQDLTAATGDQAITGAFISSTAQLFAPTLPGPWVITLGHISSTAQLFAFVISVPAPAAPERRPFRPLAREHVEFAIDGQAVPADMASGWELSDSAHGGSEALRGLVLPKRYLPWGAEEGTRIEAFRSSGGRLWGGTLLGVPKLRDGSYSINGEGPREQLRRLRRGHLYQARGPYSNLWQPAEGEPYLYGDSEKIDTQILGGRVLHAIKKTGETIADQAKSGAVAWLAGEDLTQIAVVLNKSADDSNLGLRIHGAVGPDGALTQIASYQLGAGNPSGTEKIESLSGLGYDLLRLALFNISGAGYVAGASFKAWETAIRIYGIATADDMSVSEILADLLERGGFGSGGVGTTAAIGLPLWWRGDGRSLADYLVDLIGWWWAIREWNAVESRWEAEAGRFEEVWTAALERGALEELEDLPAYGSVVQPWLSVDGSSQEAVAGDGSPEWWSDALSDAQPDDSLAQQVAEIRLAELDHPRVRGEVSLFEVKDGNGDPAHPFAVKAGTLLDLPDYEPSIEPTRIMRVVYSPGDAPARAALEEDNSVEARLARRELARLRKR